MSTSARAVCITIEGDRVRVQAPLGHLSDRNRSDLRAVFDLIRPLLARACSAPLPPRESWPDSWREVWAERVAIVRENNSIDVDPEAMADADLRVMIARGHVEELPPLATSE